MQIIAVRHGETNENAAGIIQGQSMGTLSGLGREQIQAVGKLLATEKFDVCYSSDLPRCRETAAAITQYHEGLQIVFDQRLRERSMKPLEGKYFTDITDWDWENDKRLDHKTPEGETWGEVIARVRSFLVDAAQQHSDNTVLVVSHGGPMRAMISIIEKQPWENVGRLSIENCEVRRWTI